MQHKPSLLKEMFADTDIEGNIHDTNIRLPK